MAGLLMALVALGMLGFVVFSVLIIVSFAKKTSKKPKLIGLVVCFVLVIVASLVYPESELEDYRVRQEEGAKETTETSLPQNSTAQEDTIEAALRSYKDMAVKALGPGEKLESITLKSRELTINVDISSGDPAPFTFMDLAESRTASLTDELLEYNELDDAWDTVVVSFKGMGSISFGKSDIVMGEYGRYFNIPTNFSLIDIGISNDKQQEKINAFVEMVEEIYESDARTMEDCAGVMNQKSRILPSSYESISDEIWDKFDFITDEYFRLRDIDFAHVNYVVISETGQKYHKDSCRTLTYTGTTVTVQDARNMGYGPCKVCNPPTQ